MTSIRARAAVELGKPVSSTRPRLVRKCGSRVAPRISSVSPAAPDWKLLSGGIRNPYVPPFGSIVYVREVTRTLVSVLEPCAENRSRAMPVLPNAVSSTSRITRASCGRSVSGIVVGFSGTSHSLAWRLTVFTCEELLKRKRSLRNFDPFAPSRCPIAGITRMTDAGMSGGKNVGSFVRLSTTNTEAMVSPSVGWTTRAPDAVPAIALTPLNCTFEANDSSMIALLADTPSDVAMFALTLMPRLPTLVNATLVRKFEPSNAPEKVTGKRGPEAEKTSMPFIVKPYVPLLALLYVRLVTFTPPPRA